MSETATLEQLLEFRCTQCWHSNCVSCELTGQSVQCSHCQAEQTVPEATPQRIARAAEMMEHGPVSVAKDDAIAYEQLSDRDLRQMVQAEYDLPPSQMDYSGMPVASSISRLFAQLVDGFLTIVSVLVGVGLLIGLNSLGILEFEPSAQESLNLADTVALNAVLYFSVLVLSIVQWNLIATSGQTLGKKLLGVRIIRLGGKTPGFFQGVVLRNWIASLLYAIPFMFLISALLIVFTESKRGLHDYIAGTRVVHA